MYYSQSQVSMFVTSLTQVYIRKHICKYKYTGMNLKQFFNVITRFFLCHLQRKILRLFIFSCVLKLDKFWAFQGRNFWFFSSYSMYRCLRSESTPTPISRPPGLYFSLLNNPFMAYF